MVGLFLLGGSKQVFLHVVQVQIVSFNRLLQNKSIRASHLKQKYALVGYLYTVLIHFEHGRAHGVVGSAFQEMVGKPGIKAVIILLLEVVAGLPYAVHFAPQNTKVSLNIYISIHNYGYGRNSGSKRRYTRSCLAKF